MSQSEFSHRHRKPSNDRRARTVAAVTMLSHIAHSAPGVDERTFECKCGHTKTVLVNYKQAHLEQLASV